MAIRILHVFSTFKVGGPQARLASLVRHPNVVSVTDVEDADGELLLVMDYVEGATLGKLLTRAAREGRRVPHEVVIRIMLDTLAGLHAAHEMLGDDGAPLEIVHRDVSPQNILLGADGVARLSDFGVARAQAKLSVTKTGQLKGKLAYMAPEQARGKLVDRRADLFALGVVMWESFSLRRLFKGESDAEVLNKVLYEPLPELRRATPLVSPALEAVVMRTLARTPEERQASALELAEQLEEIAKTEGLLATARDVARCLDGFFGEELTGHRDGIRSLLSSAPRRLNAPGVPLGTGSDRDVAMLAQEPATVAEPRGSVRAPSSEHSVAAIQLEGQRPSAPPSPEARRSHRWVLAAGLGLIVGGLGTAGVAVYQQRQHAIEPTATLPNEPPAIAPTPSASSAPATSVSTAASAEIAPVMSSAPVVSPSTSAKPSPPSTSKVKKSRPAAGGDDIGGNPYRQ